MAVLGRVEDKTDWDLREEIGVPGTVESLQTILSLQLGRRVGHDEAQEIAYDLVEFYETLAQESNDEPAD